MNIKRLNLIGMSIVLALSLNSCDQTMNTDMKQPLAKKTDKEVIVSVADTGIGIEKCILSRLFEISAIRSTHGTANEKGSRLGLVICKEFVERIGGRIWAESDGPGSGARFCVELKSAGD